MYPMMVNLVLIPLSTDIGTRLFRFPDMEWRHASYSLKTDWFYRLIRSTRQAGAWLGDRLFHGMEPR